MYLLFIGGADRRLRRAELFKLFTIPSSTYKILCTVVSTRKRREEYREYSRGPPRLAMPYLGVSKGNGFDSSRSRHLQPRLATTAKASDSQGWQRLRLSCISSRFASYLRLAITCTCQDPCHVHWANYRSTTECTGSL